MHQAQCSTEEQLDRLKILVADQEYDLDNLGQQNLRAIVAIANFNGLYDAADFVSNQSGREKINLHWR
jgi:hypothetical protein